jgi:hypothetical protein
MTRTTRLLIGVWGAAVATAAVGVHFGWRPLLAQTSPSPKAHWEPYKARSPKPSVDQKLTDPVLTGAIDLHAHHGPDAYDRQWDGFEVVKLAKERGMRAVVLKNHWTETAGFAQLIRKYGTQGIETGDASCGCRPTIPSTRSTTTRKRAPRLSRPATAS